MFICAMTNLFWLHFLIWAKSLPSWESLVSDNFDWGLSLSICLTLSPSKMSVFAIQLSIKCRIFFAKTLLLFLLKCNFLVPTWCSSKLQFSIKPISFCLQKFFIRAFTSFRCLPKLVLSFLVIILDKISLVPGDMFRCTFRELFSSDVLSVSYLRGVYFSEDHWYPHVSEYLV